MAIKTFAKMGTTNQKIQKLLVWWNINSCEILNEKKTTISFGEIFNGNLNNQIEIFRRMENNLEERMRKKTENNFPRDLSDPLDCDRSRFG